MNIDFLIRDSKEKFYFLGFFAADGCLHGESLTITLHKKDECLLTLFLTWLGLAGKKLYLIRDTYLCLTKYRKGISEYFLKYNITPKKSLTLNFPNNIPEEYVRYFILGYFDGDGSCYTNKDKSKLYFNITGTYDVVSSIKAVFNTSFGCKYGSIQKYKSVYRLIFNGTKSSIDFGKWLYSDEVFCPLLRKKAVFDEYLLNNIDKYNSGLSIHKAREIRNFYAARKVTQKQLALVYNVSRCTISDVIRNKLYKE